MAEIKIDYMNYCNVNMSSPNSCNSSNLNQQNRSTNLNDQNNLNKNLNQKNIINNEINKINNQNDNEQNNEIKSNGDNLNDNKSPNNTSSDLNNKQENLIHQNGFKITDNQQKQQNNNFDKSINNLKFLNNNFVTQDDIGQLLSAFQERAYKSAEYKAKDERIQLMCLNLFNYDYRPDELLIINNNESDLSGTYPVKLIIPKANAFPIECERLRNLFSKAKYARCRCRFPVPIILFNNKYVCRSATLSHCIEIYSNKGIYANLFKSGEEQIQDIGAEIKELNLESLETSNFDPIDTQLTAKKDDINSSTGQNDKTISKSNGYFSAIKHDYSHTVNEARTHDITLLNYLNVKHIIDLMVEMKKVKFGLNVASSEKADKLNRYRDFNIICLPYPGCEFFKSYRDNNFNAEGLIYDWDQNFVDACLKIPKKNDIINNLQINYDNYKNWDLNDLTLNYLKLILTYLVQPNSESILLHCISGWDRTPGFSSLIRLSLWADYELHQNLNYEQILYLTLAYDWYLFGHDLNDRVDKGEVIMHYCFYFLKYLSAIEYSIDYLRKNIVKKGNEYVRVRYNCCDVCKKEESSCSIDKQHQKQPSQFNDSKNRNDETKLSLEIDEEISSSMYSSQASTVVNNNLKKEQILNHYNNTSGNDSETNSSSLCSSGNQTPKDNGLINSCFLITAEPLQPKQEHKQQQSQSRDEKLIKSFKCENQDVVDHVVDHVELTNGTINTISTKQHQQQQQMFIIDPNFDQNISASPSSFAMYKDLRNNSINSLNRNSLTIESTDLNKFDVISLDDQSISSNSSYDVLNAVNKQQQVVSYTNNINQQQLTLNNQSTIAYHSNSISHSHQQSQNGLNFSSNQQQLKNNNLKQQESLIKHNNCELIRRDSFSCGTPPKLVSNVYNLDDDEEQNLHLKSKLIQDADEDEDEEDILSSSCESNTLAEDVDTVDCKNNNSNIQRSNAVAIPSRNRQNNFNSSSISEHENLNWSNDHNSNLSNTSNTSNRLSDQSFNSWQLVTDTGSVRKETFLSSTSLDDIKRNMNSKSNSNKSPSTDNDFNRLNNIQYYVPTCCCKNINCGKYCEQIAKYNKDNDLEKFIYTRAKRLSDVRVVFYQCYVKIIGLTTNYNASGNEFNSKIHNFINKTSSMLKSQFKTTSNGNNFTRNSNTRLSQQNNKNRKSRTQFQSYIEDNSDDKNKDLNS